MEPVLEISQITKSFEDTRALDGVSIEVYSGEILALLGPSGCGKSTLLGLIAGLDSADSGDVLWGGQSLTGIPPHERGFGLMFQDYALFPHLSVAANIAFGLRFQELDRSEIDLRVRDLLALVDLEGFESRDVTSLSGGEQQRVALARSLAPRPRLLMLDEPLGALDAALRERLLSDLQNILRKLNQTALYVTHDQAEAFAVADRVVVMRSGRVEQIGTPKEIFSVPGSRFVAEFLGFDNFIKGDLVNAVLKTPIGTLEWPSARLDGPVDVLLRPDGALIGGTGPGLVISGTVRKISFRGMTQRVRLETAYGTLRFSFPNDAMLPAVTSELKLTIQKDAIQIFRKEHA